jgi:hypothetical protein
VLGGVSVVLHQGAPHVRDAVPVDQKTIYPPGVLTQPPEPKPDREAIFERKKIACLASFLPRQRPAAGQAASAVASPGEQAEAAEVSGAKA